MWRAAPLEKALMLGKIEGRRRRGLQRMRWLAGITDSMDMSLSNSRSWWWIGSPGVVLSIRSQRVGEDWETALNWTDLKTCPTRFPGAQRASLHSDSLRDCWRSTAIAAWGSITLEADGKCLYCLVIANPLGKCQFVVDSNDIWNLLLHVKKMHMHTNIDTDTLTPTHRI